MFVMSVVKGLVHQVLSILTGEFTVEKNLINVSILKVYLISHIEQIN